LVVSVSFAKAARSDTLPAPPKKPNTRININGKAKLNATAEGLRKMEIKPAFVMASMALIWL